MNIPLHIAEQGKEKIDEYIDLYQKKEQAGALARKSEDRLDEAFREMQDIFVMEERRSNYYSEFKLKRRSLWSHLDKYYSYSENKKTMERIKVTSQFADEVWTKNQVLQDATFDRIEKLIAYQEAKEKFDEFR